MLRVRSEHGRNAQREEEFPPPLARHHGILVLVPSSALDDEREGHHGSENKDALGGRGLRRIWAEAICSSMRVTQLHQKAPAASTRKQRNRTHQGAEGRREDAEHRGRAEMLQHGSQIADCRGL